ncbi:MAG: NADH-quinone oxidoreductase subunit NuoH [Anaerolineae bacterium]|nr:MAG: NADH-quinone oxidoreductase subunit NuoH [Anaerolineae bacterium]
MGDPFALISQWFTNLLLGWGLSESAATVIRLLVGAVILATISMLTVVVLIWVERKLAGRLQDRPGPNRAGKFGLLQPIADMIKIFTKEIVTPAQADKTIFHLAPVVFIASVLLMWVVIPFTATVMGANLNVAVLYVVAVGAFGVVAVLMAGWSSNNKFALLGAFRAVAQMVSYEVPMVLALMVPVLLARSMGLTDIVNAQSVWFIVAAPIAAVIFLITSMAEVGRAPFDLLEAESEIVAGYHTEYSGMEFGMFYVAEFLHVWTIGALLGTLFLGGWRGPGAETYPLLGILYFYIKTFIGYFIVTWIRLSLPRIRIDQMLAFNWKFLTPLILVVLIFTAILDKVLEVYAVSGWGHALSMLALNVVIGWATVQALKKVEKSRQRRRPEFPPRPVAVAPKSE